MCCESCGRTRKNVEVTSDKDKLFAVVTGDKDTYCLAMVCTSSRYANKICGGPRDYRIQEFDCKDKPKLAPYPVYAVSVGKGDQYRIVNLLVNKQQAHKMASSIRGSVSVYEAVSSTPEPAEVRFYKYFIPLGTCNRDDDYYYMDSFRRRVLVYDNQDTPPTIIRRRRYDDGLPYRLEVAATNQDTAQLIAEKFYKEFQVDETSVSLMEYNVEYTLFFNQDNNSWEIDPCLLQTTAVV